MASPVLESFCCMFNGTLNGSKLYLDEDYWSIADDDFSYNLSHSSFSLFNSVTDQELKSGGRTVQNNWNLFSGYNWVCLFSSFLSVCGAIYQLLPKRSAAQQAADELANVGGCDRGGIDAVLRENDIICCLAIADLLASLGVFVRSILWLAGVYPEQIPVYFKVGFTVWSCVFITAWVQYFYICTYVWTFLYALDVFLLAKKPNLPRCIAKIMPGVGCCVLYHAFAWGVTSILCIGSLIPIYFPSLTQCSTALSELLPKYLLTYICILLVMILNPILYYKTYKQEQDTLAQRMGDTALQRAYLLAKLFKFRMFIGVFYTCWLVNILNGILLLLKLPKLHVSIPAGLETAVWYLLGLLNPLQALLNCIVYRAIGLTARCMLRHLSINGEVSHDTSERESRLPTPTPNVEIPGETSPLLNHPTA